MSIDWRREGLHIYKERFLTLRSEMTDYGFPIQAFGNDRSVVIPRSLEIVGNDRGEEKYTKCVLEADLYTVCVLKSGLNTQIV